MKTFDKLKENSWLISLVLVSLVFLKQCSISSDQDKIQKDIRKITGKIDSLPSQNQIQETMNQTMFNFLIFEDDFDHKKVSLSEIKSKIDVKK